MVPTETAADGSTTTSSTMNHTREVELSNTPPSLLVRSNNNTNNRRLSGSGLGQWLLDAALASPVWKYIMVPAARQKIIDTAQQNGIPWMACKAWLLAQDGPWNKNSESDVSSTEAALWQSQLANIPSWYATSAYHAYETGHLSWEAAVEIELAGAAIGARNMPAAARHGETVFRRQFHTALVSAGAVPPTEGILVDVGCGTGTSTRLLAAHYPQAASITGIDLSPYFCAVGTRLLELAPTSDVWVCDIQPEPRIRYQWGNAADMTALFADCSVDVVNVQFVAHELPVAETLKILKEAHRVLKPGGQLWLCEMDFQAPAYAAQRANPVLFSLIRSTEPYLDEYADGQADIWQCLRDTFAATTIAAATGRHFACVAVKGDNNSTFQCWNDWRFDEQGNYRVDDTHLQVWENKK
jgi:ubiquinone/menaquinone biosynthesis C-methylase UbiE